MTFTECLHSVWANDDLMREYRRLSGSAIGIDNRHPIERLVDQAAGYEPTHATADEVGDFLHFVWDTVWTRLPNRKINGSSREREPGRNADET